MSFTVSLVGTVRGRLDFTYLRLSAQTVSTKFVGEHQNLLAILRVRFFFS